MDVFLTVILVTVLAILNGIAFGKAFGWWGVLLTAAPSFFGGYGIAAMFLGGV